MKLSLACARPLLVALLLATPCLPGAPAAREPEVPADLVVLNARIYTASKRGVRVTAMAVRGGRIVAIGDDRRVQPLIGTGTQVIDMWGKTILPGFVDSHGHVQNLGERLELVDLVGTGDAREVVDEVRARAEKQEPGTWVRGRGWDQNDWPDSHMPTHAPLTEAVPNHPVLLTRVDGHAAWVNRRALELAGITRDTPDPPGGEILRDERGEPTGVLVDAAVRLVSAKVPPPTPEVRERRLKAALDECARLGITMVHDAGIDQATLTAYRALVERGEMPIRVYAMARAGGDLVTEVLARGPDVGNFLMLRAIKVTLDGAMGSRGALLRSPYADRPDHYGLLTFPYDSLVSLSEMAFARGLQMRVHAIGDSANRLALDAYQAAFNGKREPEARFAIEHAQLVRRADFDRFARLGVAASIQSSHATSDAPWIEDRLGDERLEGAYAWRTFLDRRVSIANGSDFPVESANPLIGIYAALTRRDLEGKLPAPGWRPQQRMIRDEALLSFTRWGAWLAFREQDLGSLEVGKRADFVVLDRDIVTCRYDLIPSTHVLRTVVDGRTVFELPLFQDPPTGASR